MPRPRRPKTGPNSVIASAARITSRRSRGNPTVTGASADWQAEAILMADTVGELGFYRLWIANALSRVKIKVIQVTPKADGTEDEVPVTEGWAWDAYDALISGDEGESQMMKQLGQHLSVPGEAWLFGIVTPDLTDIDAPDQWRVLSHTEVRETAGYWVVDRGDAAIERYFMGDPKTGEGAEAIAIRIWQPHPDRWAQATSSVRGALPVLRQLRGLAELDGAAIDSRLKGAGILAIPQEATFAAPAEQNGDPQDPRQDEFMAALTETMMLARSDRASAAAHVPTVMKVPGDLIAKIRHITFDTPFDERSADKVEQGIQRLATALDTPAEVLKGLADVNHWTGWLLDENAVKLHLEPLIAVITTGLTTRYLWPANANTLTGQIDVETRTYRIKADTSALRQKPDKSAIAPTLWGDLIITDKALAREAGNFSGEDLLDPTSEEYRRRLLQRVATAAPGPDLVMQALKLLGLSVTQPVMTATQVPNAPAAPPQLPSAEKTPPERPTAPPDASPPATAASAAESEVWRAAALAIGCEARVERAIERAWGRVGSRGRTRRPVAREHLDRALEGAWEQVPRIAATLSVDEERLRGALDLYTRTVLTSGDPHVPAVLVRVLQERVLDA